MRRAGRLVAVVLCWLTLGLVVGVALVSGAIAGIAGVSEVAGIQYRLTSGLSPGYGYTGIVVAMLGGLTMPGVVASALLLGDLAVGASSAERSRRSEGCSRTSRPPTPGRCNRSRTC